MKTTHRMDSLISVQTNLDDAKKRLDKAKTDAGIFGTWTLETASKELKEAYIYWDKAEAIYNAVLDALQAKQEYAEKITDAFMRDCMN